MKFWIICDFYEAIVKKSERLAQDHPPLESIIPIKNSIKKLGYDCEIFGGIDTLIHTYHDKIKYTSDNIFLNFSDGLTQNNRRIQAPMLCELIGVNYSGSGPFEVALMNNKYFSKIAVQDIKLLCPKGILLTSNTNIDGLNKNNITFPVIIKPNLEGSSVGIYQKNVVYNFNDLKNNTKDLLKKFDEVLIEQYIPGIDITTFVIGRNNKILFNESLAYKTFGKFFQDYEIRDSSTKSKHLSTKHLIQTVVSDTNVIKMIKKQSEYIFNHLGCKDLARIDYRLTKTNDLYFIEINSLPRISQTSEAGALCEMLNISYLSFIELYIQSVLYH